MSFLKKLIITLGLTASTIVSAALPTNIYFTNNTSLGLNATIAGRPGKPINPKVSNYAVPYMGVYVACQYSGQQGNCPIEFTDQSNGQRVATVSINADKGMIVSAPALHGQYAVKYEVSGWSFGTQLSHIYINEL